MENIRPKGDVDQSIEFPSGLTLGRYVHVRRYERTRNYPQQYDPEFGSARE